MANLNFIWRTDTWFSPRLFEYHGSDSVAVATDRRLSFKSSLVPFLLDLPLQKVQSHAIQVLQPVKMRLPFGSYFLWSRNTTGKEVSTDTPTLEKRTPRSATNPQLCLETFEVARRSGDPQQNRPWRAEASLGEARVSSAVPRRPRDAAQLQECDQHINIEDDLHRAGHRLDNCSDRLDQMHSSAVRIRRELEDLQAALTSLATRESNTRPKIGDFLLGQKEEQQSARPPLQAPLPESPETETPRVESLQIEPPAQAEAAREDARDTTLIPTTPDAPPPRAPRATSNQIVQSFPLQPSPLPETAVEKPPLPPQADSGKVQDIIQFWSKMQQT